MCVCDRVCESVCVAYMQSATELPVVPHLDVDPLIQTEADEVQGLLNSVGGGLLRGRSVQGYNQHQRPGSGNMVQAQIHPD